MGPGGVLSWAQPGPQRRRIMEGHPIPLTGLAAADLQQPQQEALLPPATAGEAYSRGLGAWQADAPPGYGQAGPPISSYSHQYGPMQPPQLPYVQGVPSDPTPWERHPPWQQQQQRAAVTPWPRQPMVAAPHSTAQRPPCLPYAGGPCTPMAHPGVPIAAAAVAAAWMPSATAEGGAGGGRGVRTASAFGCAPHIRSGSALPPPPPQWGMEEDCNRPDCAAPPPAPHRLSRPPLPPDVAGGMLSPAAAGPPGRVASRDGSWYGGYGTDSGAPVEPYHLPPPPAAVAALYHLGSTGGLSAGGYTGPLPSHHSHHYPAMPPPMPQVVVGRKRTFSVAMGADGWRYSSGGEGTCHSCRSYPVPCKVSLGTQRRLYG